MNLSRLALVALASARATRFVTTDLLGEWTVVGPLKRWAARREVPSAELREKLEDEIERTTEREAPMFNPPPAWGWRSKLVKGLDCPFCVGFWVGGAVLLGEVLTGRTRLLRGVWTFVLGAFALNYAVGHASKRID